MAKTTIKKTPTQRKTSTPKSLEDEAKEFFSNRVQSELPTGSKEGLSLRSFYAGSALSGLLAAGRTSRAEELVDEAFRYADFMLRKK